MSRRLDRSFLALIQASKQTLLGPVNTNRIIALLPKFGSGKAQGVKFGEPNERRATPHEPNLGATRRAAALFSAILRCSPLVELATRRALRLVLRKKCFAAH